MKLKNYLLLSLLLAVSIFSLNAADQESDGEKLVDAASREKWDTVRGLLANPDIDVNVRSKDGYTALMWTCGEGNVDIVKLLLVAGAKTEAADEDGDTALMWACYNEHTGIVRVLLEVGAKTEVENEQGKTALEFAKHAGNDEIIGLLQDRDSHKQKKGSAPSGDESILTLSNAVIVIVVASVCGIVIFWYRIRRAKNKNPNSTPDRAQKQTS